MEMEQEALMPEVLPPERDAPNGGNGRPRGAKNLKHRALERAARSEALPIVLKVCELAKQGDMLAARIILDRVYPRPRTSPVSVDLPATATPAELRAAMHKLIGDVASGRIAPDEGQSLVAMMRDVIDAHRIQTFDAPGAGEAQQTNARDQLRERLVRAMEERNRKGIAAGEEG